MSIYVLTNRVVKMILKAGIQAPSAMNKQSWQVRVVQNQELLKRMNQGFIAYSKKNNPEKDF